MKRVCEKVISLITTITLLLGMLQSLAFAQTAGVNDTPDEVRPLQITEVMSADAESVDVASAKELEAALAANATSIRLTADFTVDRTFFVPYDVVIFCEQAIKLTRAADFAGDIFVVGEDKGATAAAQRVTLSIGGKTEEAVLTIDGNKQNLTVDVAGTVFFVCSFGNVDVYANTVVTNHKKTANDRTAVAAHGLSYPDRVGGAIAIISNDATMNVMGGTYSDSEISLAEDATASYWGGAFYNFGTLNIYGGIISGNKAMRGGAIYNYRRLHIYNAEIKGNASTTTAGAIYCPASTGSFTYIGEDNAFVPASVLFEGNTAGNSHGGAIGCQATMEIYNTTFFKNTTTESGGAFYAANNSKVAVSNSKFSENTAGGIGGAIYVKNVTLDIEDTSFEKNVADSKGGAICMSGVSTKTENVDLFVRNSTFTDNTGKLEGGAIYLSGDATAYATNVDFNGNKTDSAKDHNGGTIFLTGGASMEINHATVTNAKAYNGGVASVIDGAKLLINDLTATQNTAVKYGGVVFSEGGDTVIYNSKLAENSGENGGALYFISDDDAQSYSTARMYNTQFNKNTASGNGGAVFIYTYGGEVLLHSCTLTENTAGNFGGALQISGKSNVKLYNITAKNNAAASGGFMYETVTGTVVDLIGVTLKGNTAPTSGPIIHGNSAGAKLNLNKALYVDEDHTGEYNDAYFKTAIANKLTVNYVDTAIPAYQEYEQPEFDTNVPSEVRTAKQLYRALLAKKETITILNSFEIDRTLYVPGTSTIKGEGAVTLKRAEGFTGALFVVGKSAENTRTAELAVLTLGDPAVAENDLLIIDGNKDAFDASVGSAIVLDGEAAVHVYAAATLRNHSAFDGAVFKVLDAATLNLWGGKLVDNEAVNGGVMYNEGTLNVYGGTVKNNTAANGGAVYNKAKANIYNAVFEDNTATNGGAVYNAAGAKLSVGAVSSVESNVTFTENTATNGGAVYTLSEARVENAAFDKNEATANGGAVYAAQHIAALAEADATIENVTFTGNKAANGGAAYLDDGVNVYLYEVLFKENVATEKGGAVFVTKNAALDAKSVSFTENAANIGGALYINENATGELTELEVIRNGAESGGAFACEGAVLKVYHSDISENNATNGGVVFTTGETYLYTSQIVQNIATKGGVVYAVGTKSSVLQDCEVVSNTAKTGGVAYVDMDSVFSLYNNVAMENTAEDGSILYLRGESTISGMTLTDTAEENGAAFSGTDTAVLNINKKTFKDTDNTVNDAYFASAIIGVGTVKTITSAPPKYADYGNEFAGELENCVNVTSSAELEKAINAGEKYIKVTADFELDRTFYIYKDITIFSTTKRTLTRAADFAGDIFVVGETPAGKSHLLLDGSANLTLGNPNSKTKNLLVIDGNRDAMKVDVTGSVLFICYSAKVETYDNLTVQNAKKIGNERALDVKYKLGHKHRIGGAFAVIASGSLDIYGGVYRNNAANEENAETNPSTNAIYGGLIYSFSNLRIHDGLFEENEGGRGAVAYNYRVAKVYGGKFKNNHASTYAGAFFVPSSSACHLIIDSSAQAEKQVVFEGNTAVKNGAAIYSDTLATVVVYNTLFKNNYSDSNGGVFCTYGQLTVRGSKFIGNEANYRGGALYLSYTRSESVTRYVTITDTVFENNKAVLGGAISAYCSSMDFKNGSIVNVTDCDFIENTAVKAKASGKEAFGGAVYADRLCQVTLTDSNFEGNTADLGGGAVYTVGKCDTTIDDCTFTSNKTLLENANGGAVSVGNAEMLIKNSRFEKNESADYAGALYVAPDADITLNKVNASENTATSNGGFAYNLGGKLTVYNSTFHKNTAANGGAMYMYTDAVTKLYKNTFTENEATASNGNGGALFIYTSGSETVVQNCTFDGNEAVNYGGALQISGVSDVKLYDIIAKNNAAAYGGFMYETKADTKVYLAGVTVSGNTAGNGSIIYGNTLNAKLILDKSKYVDLDHTGTLGAAYFAQAIANKLTVEYTTLKVPACDDFDEGKAPTGSSKVVKVTDVFNLAKSSSDASISVYYDKLPKLTNTSNFMSRGTTKFSNINGKTASVDSFVYEEDAKADNGTIGEGLLIYQALEYKKANPNAEVYIDIASYRFSVQTAININRNSRYFGYMRDLVGVNYDKYGFVRVSYLLITAAKMGIHVNVIGQRDAYPISSTNPNFYEYFTGYLQEPCDTTYVKKGKIGDYLDFNFCYWTLEEKGGTDMMHTKLCAVSHYLDKNGKAHKDAVWSSSANLDGVKYNGRCGNWKSQTSTIVSDHAEIYNASVNYLRLISDHCGQEEIYEFQHIVNTRNKKQIDLIKAGRGNEIPKDEQIVYIGTKNDNVFEMYFTPLGGNAVAWEPDYNPYTKYLTEMYNSKDYIYFIWNLAEASSGFPLGMQIDSMIIEAFHRNKNPKNRIYMNMEKFNSAAFDDLEVGKDIGYMSFNGYDFGEVHQKDMQLSYVKNGTRQFVSLLNSLNYHSGSMCYQSNFILVVKETGSICEGGSVFGTIADLTTRGDFSGHNYGAEYPYYSASGKDGTTYRKCKDCGYRQKTGVAHRESGWVIDKAATASARGIRHTECTVCGELVRSEEYAFSYTNTTLTGQEFSKSTSVSTGAKKTPLTIEATIQLSKSYSDRAGVIVGNYDGSKKGQINLEVYTKGRPRLYYQSGSAKNACTFNTDIRSSGKKHIAVTVDGKKASLYVDGKLVETKTLKTTLPSISTTLKIGGDNRSGNSQYFKGKIYSVALFKDVRTASEIKKDKLLVTGEEYSLLYTKYFTTDSYSATTKLEGKGFKKSDKYTIATLSKSVKTIEATVRIASKARGGVIVGNYNGGKSNQLNLEIESNARVKLYFKNNGKTVSCLFSKKAPIGTPTHIAVTVSGKTATLYIDGKKVESKKLSVSLPAITSDLRIGGDNRSGNAQYFKGKIYAVNMFSDVRTASEIKKDAVVVTGTAPSLVYSAYFTNTTAGGYAAKAELVGEGFNKYERNTIGTLRAAPKTIEATVRLASTGRSGVVVGNYSGGKQAQINLEIVENARVRLYYRNGSSKMDCVFSKKLSTSTPTHIAVTINGRTATLYVNGVKAESKKLSMSLPNAKSGFVIGGDNRSGNTQYFKGKIYSVNLFSDVRTASEIKKDAVLVTSSAPSILYSGYFTTAVCSYKTKGTGHAEKWVTDFSAGTNRVGVKHKECTSCKQVLEVVEIPATNRPVQKLYYGNTVGLNAVDKTSSKVLKDLSAKPMTFEVSFRLPTSVDEQAGILFGNNTDGKEDQLNLEIYTNGRPRFVYKVGGTSYTAQFKTDVRSKNIVHMAITVSKTTAKLYVNGSLKETLTLKKALPDVRSGFCVGGDNRELDALYFAGNVYGCQLFSDLRTTSEMKRDRYLVLDDTAGLLYSKYFA